MIIIKLYQINKVIYLLFLVSIKIYLIIFVIVFKVLHFKLKTKFNNLFTFLTDSKLNLRNSNPSIT